MTADDLSAPLGQGRLKAPLRRRRKFPLSVPQVIAGALALFVGMFVLWAVVGNNPFGGEPMVAVPIDLHAATKPKKPDQAAAPEAVPPAGQAAARNDSSGEWPGRDFGPGKPGQRRETKTVTIIDGKTGERQEVVTSGRATAPVRPNGVAPSSKNLSR